MHAIPLPAPFGGVQERIPKVGIQSPQCQKMLNFNVTQDGVALRHGDALVANARRGVSGAGTVFNIHHWGDRLFVVYSDGNITIKDVTGTTADFVAAGGGTGAHFLYFNKYLFVFIESSGLVGFAFNGAWAATGWTGTNLKPVGGDVYKNRAYLIQSAEAAYWYTGISQISGALPSKVDLSNVISDTQGVSNVSKLLIIAAVTLADTVSSTVLQAFVFSTGEVLFYDGDYPDAANWAQVGRGRIGTPLNYNTGVQYQGDYLVFCDTGVVSLRDLFLKGSQEAQALSVNANIQKTWIELVNAYRTSVLGLPLPNVHGIWDQTGNRIVISFPCYIDDDGTFQNGSFYFIFDALQQSWFFHQSFGIETGTGFGNILGLDYWDNPSGALSPPRGVKGVYLLGQNSLQENFAVFQKEGADNFLDELITGAGNYTAIEFEIISAPSDGGRVYVMKTQGLDLISDSDLYADIGVSLIGDFGVQTSAVQVNSGVAVVSGAIQKPFYNIGIEASYTQYKISGATVPGTDDAATIGFTLYGTNLWYDQGASPR